MAYFDRLSIRRKFSLLLCVSFIFLLAVGVISAYKAVKAHNSSQYVVSTIIPSIEAIGRITATFKEVRISAIKLPTAQGKAKDSLIEKYTNDSNSLRSDLKKLENVFSADKLEPAFKTIEKYDHVVKNVLSHLCDKGRVFEATTVISEQLVPLGNEFDRETDMLSNDLEIESVKSSNELESDVNPTITIVVLVIVIIVNALALKQLANSIASRVRVLAQSSDNISSGDLTKAVPHLGNDELGTLRQNLNNLTDNLHAIVSDMNNDAVTLSTSSQDLTRVANEIDSKATNVLDKLITVSSASEEMAATSQEISSNCNLAATSSDATQKMALEGMDSVINTVNEIRVHSQKTHQDAQLILELDHKTQEINTIITTIEDIASQTNLLALNAAIEAARAGEHGKGFAVVADEVRALAVRTAEATKKISTMITTVSSDVKNANESITETVEKMGEIATNAEGLQSTLKQITDKIGEVNMEITQIAAATEQQSSTSKEMSLNLQSIKDITRDMADTAHHSENIASTFKDISSRMNTTVGKFTI